jgi:transcription antitermination protein NusB
MASNRHLGRIIVLQTVYEFVFRNECGDDSADLDEILGRNIDRYSSSIKDTDFIKQFAQGIVEQSEELDGALQPLAPEWPLTQIARIDHCVLRLGAYELIHHTDVPPKVAINEAVELAKSFGSDSSSRFVNGVLGTLLRSRNPELAGKDTDVDKKETEV